MRITINPKKIYNKEEFSFFNNLNLEQKKNFLKNEYNIKNSSDNIPIRFKILKLNINNSYKNQLLNQLKIINTNDDSNSSDYFKYMNYFKIITSIPFNKFKNININKNNNRDVKQYLINSKNKLDQTLYSQNNIKQQFIEFIAKFISNPSSQGYILGIQGPPGIGKTTLIKNGLSDILNRPVHIINLSGNADSSYLNGHSFTYEGSKPGKIIDILISSNCMNPIIYFDELDKLSNTSQGKEIENLLINITDTSQNNLFEDKFLSNIPIDLSKIIFIFAYNNSNNISPILLDRINEFKLNGYNIEEKSIILLKYIIPNIIQEFNLNSQINFSKNSIEYIVNKYNNNEDGMRNLKKKTYKIISLINLAKISNDPSIINLNTLNFPLKININIIKKIILNINY
jgi:ATP-dependent Lon protease